MQCVQPRLRATTRTYYNRPLLQLAETGPAWIVSAFAKGSSLTNAASDPALWGTGLANAASDQSPSGSATPGQHPRAGTLTLQQHPCAAVHAVHVERLHLRVAARVEVDTVVIHKCVREPAPRRSSSTLAPPFTSKHSVQELQLEFRSTLS